MIREQAELETALVRLEQAGRAGGDRDRQGFNRAVLALLFERRAGLPGEPREIAAEEARVRVGEGFPLLDPGRLRPDPAAAAALYGALLDLVAVRSTMPGEAIEAANSLAGRPDELAVMLEEWLRGEAPGGAAGFSPEGRELLAFLLHGTLRPFLERHALRWGGLETLAAWDRGSCPVCGGAPALGTLEGEEGTRMLHCGACGHAWHFQRVRCPFCDTAGNEKLRYITIEGEPGWRIDVCDACTGYLKTLDTRERGGAAWVAEAEDLATPHLDVVALREGFTRKGPNVLGLSR